MREGECGPPMWRQVPRCASSDLGRHADRRVGYRHAGENHRVRRQPPCSDRIRDEKVEAVEACFKERFIMKHVFRKNASVGQIASCEPE